MNINHRIVTINNDDNMKYFVLQEVFENSKEYCLLLNINNEKDIRIMEEEKNGDKITFFDVDDKDLCKDLATILESNIKKEQELYS